MQIKRGIAVSPGVAISQAIVLDVEDQPVPRRMVAAAQVPQEQQRLEEALAQSVQEVEQTGQQVAARVGAELGSIFDVHKGLLQDPHLIGQIKQKIAQERVTAEYAVYAVMRDLAGRFQGLEAKYFRERDTDIWDLERRILGHLIGRQRAVLGKLRTDVILIAHDLTPSQTATLDKEKVKGIATDAGGRTSHTAILAHALGIPAIVGLEDLSSQVNTDDTVIIDGNRGLVIINPDAGQLMEYRQQQRRIAAMETSLDDLAGLPAQTLDGTAITLCANIEFPNEIPAALQRGAVGIGLYRTEFLFLSADAEPTEEQQYNAYRQAIMAMDGKPMTIRTLDLGADKLSRTTTPEHPEPNPFLGCRSIRLCLQNLPLFKTQLRAILRASTQGPVRIMFPLISNIMELRQAKMILTDVAEDLEEEGIPFRRATAVGIMVEVPSAALQAATFAREADFFSIGTNDLIQYTVAVDRGNERIASLYSPAHPAVIQLLKEVVRAANRHRVEVSLCGEMAGEPEFVMLLLGLGLRNLSMTPPAIPEVKRIVRSVTIAQCQRLARKVSAMDSDREILNYLRDEVRKIIPEALDGRSIDV